jgi:hypothetical protein
MMALASFDGEIGEENKVTDKNKACCCKENEFRRQ